METSGGCLVPSAPKTLAETGLDADLVRQIVIKTMHLTGAQSGAELAGRLGVTFTVVEPCVDALKRDRLCEVVSGSMNPAAFTYRLTEGGHSKAAEFNEHNQYAGCLPVPIDQYRAYMDAFHRTTGSNVTRDSVRSAFQHLVVSERVLDQIGPAVAARHSLFLFGPPGNGKTKIARAIGSLLSGEIAIPHAVAVDGEIIRLFDAMNHDPVDSKATSSLFSMNPTPDNRWVRCRRPVVTVGGELTMDSLELGFLPSYGYYRAPLQTLANGGMLIIDDFGRQRSSPTEILNRWIVPLESRVDHLVLQSGQKFEIPFEVLIVFSTNLNPLDLLDESFLRRIRYKVYAQSPSTDDFIAIFERCCQERGLPFAREMAEALIRTELEPRQVQLRGCQPRDLIEHALSLAAYVGTPNRLSLDLLSAACATYFIGGEANGDER